MNQILNFQSSISESKSNKNSNLGVQSIWEIVQAYPDTANWEELLESWGNYEIAKV